MNPLKVTEWSKEAFKVALGMTVFLLALCLIVDGINWLIWGSRFDKDLFSFALFAFCGIYFTEAINSVHERLNKIEHAVRINNGQATT
jgi:hypothetical protein